MLVVFCVFAVTYVTAFLSMSGAIEALSGADNAVLESVYSTFTSTYIFQLYVRRENSMD